jgi:hypothetical protein
MLEHSCAGSLAGIVEVRTTMRNTKGTHLISVRGTQYRWRAQGDDECISIGIWPEKGLGAYIGGRLGYHIRG